MNRLPDELLRAVEAGATILVPRAELAFTLHAAFNLQQAAAGRAVWKSARILPLADWARAQFLDELRRGAPLRRLLNRFEERELWRRCLDESALADALLDREGAARNARLAFNAMLEYGIGRRELDRYATDDGRALADLLDRFAHACSERQALAECEALSQVRPAQALCWIESGAWTPARRQWLLQHAGAPIEPLARAPDVVLAHRARDPYRELEAMAQWAVEQLRQDATRRLWLCVPDLAQRREQLGAIFDAHFAPERLTLGEPARSPLYAIAGGTPLADYSVVHAALELLQSSDSVLRFERFSALLRSPYLDESMCQAAKLDAALRAVAPAAATLAQWLVLCDAIAAKHSLVPPALARLHRAQELLGQLTDRAPLSRWAALFAATLAATVWSRGATLTSIEYQAAERCREVLAELAAADAEFPRIDRAHAIGLTGRALQGTPFQPATGVPAVWISSRQEDPWVVYDGLWLADLRERNWPAAADPLPWLPASLQTQFGIVQASAAGQRRHAFAVERAWLSRGAQLIASCPMADAEVEVRPSVWLAQLGPQSIEVEDSRIAVPAHWRKLWRARSIETITDEPLLPVDPARAEHAVVATLQWQSACPFQAFARGRLGASRLMLPLPALNDLERGTLAHKALEFLWRELRDQAQLRMLDAAAQRAAVRRAVERALRSDAVRRNPYARWREVEGERLTEELDSWLEVERTREFFRVQDIELDIAPVIGDLPLRGRIDRVDELADGRHVLIDYKSGAQVAKDWLDDPPKNPQLLIYALQYPATLAAVGYAALARPKQKFVGLSSPVDLQNDLPAWRQRVEALARAYRDGRAQVAPRDGACERCHLGPLCRIAETRPLP